MINLIIAVVGILAGAGIGYFLRKILAQKQAGNLEEKLSKLSDDAKEKAREVMDKAKSEALNIIEESRKEEKERKDQIAKLEERLLKREDALDVKVSKQEQEEKTLQEKAEKLKSLKEEFEVIKQKQISKLEEISGYDADRAKGEMFNLVEQKSKEELVKRMDKLDREGQDAFEKKAKEILTTALQRFSGSQSGETMTTTLKIPSEEIKGKIIGREGRNIKAIEKMTGVEIIIDDTPEAILISSFDPVRRQICKIALEKLIADGRIQPAKIEETVEKAKEEVSQKIKEAGEEAVKELKIIGMDPRLIALLGRLKYRTSFGQNVLEHSLEAAHISGMLAEELGADVKITKMGALFHDIGKAVDHEVQGTHVDIGKKILQKFNIDQRVIQAMQSHHDEYPYETLEAILVQVAESVSASRPGARRGTLETYIKRLEELEAIAMSFEGIEKSYAISAGRELRVFVKPEVVDDLEARKLARKIADRIEEELKYPGEIKVNVIRENRVIEYAR